MRAAPDTIESSATQNAIICFVQRDEICRELDHPENVETVDRVALVHNSRRGGGHVHRLKRSGSTFTIPFVVEAALSMKIG